MAKEVQQSPGKQLQITECLKSRLYPYQVEGLEFFYNAYRKGKKGIILADEMGLGKSIQVISFLASFASLETKNPSILLVVPTNLIYDWVSKIRDWAPGLTCLIYHQSEQLQARNLREVKRKGGILITTYRMIIGHEKDLSYQHSSPYVWNFTVFDEAHRLKNEKTKTYKVASSVKARFRILLTGTPIQNNLKELWNLLSLISETCLVGTYQTFRKNFENPITRGREADARADERALAQELMEYVKNTIQPVWLRRTKDQLPKLPDKREFVLWTKLTAEQEAEYRRQLSVDEASDDLSTLKLLHNLRKICCVGRQFERHAFNASESQITHSGKLAVLIALLKKMSSEGHKILVFFQYVDTLKMVRYNLVQTDWGQRTVLFMDGTIELSQRTRLLKSFQNGSQSILLLTVQVGAEGLNLTTADRVIIMEPSWNQCTDAQAVDRVHRIGQKREVKVYRFITCGTVEEKIYRRQLFKGSLARQAVGDDQNPLRHFTRSELMELKTLGETQYSATQSQLEYQNSKCLSIEEILGKQLGEQISGSLYGVSDHSQLLKASQGEDLEAEMEKLHIADEVQRSKEEIEGEAHLKCTIPSVDAHTHKNRQSLGVYLKGKENGTILNDNQNKHTKNKRKSLINPVYSVRYSGKIPGLPRKYKQFSSPFTGSLRRKRRIPRPPQYLDPDQSCYVVDTKAERDEMGDCNSPRDLHNSDDFPPGITFTDESVCEAAIKPVSSIQCSGRTPGLPRKYIQCSSPFSGSVWKKRRITHPLQYIDFDISSHTVDIQAELDGMGNSNSPRDANNADDLPSETTFTDDNVCENYGISKRDSFADNSQQTQIWHSKDTPEEEHADVTEEVDNSESLTQYPIKTGDTENACSNTSEHHFSSPKAASATGSSLHSLVKSQDQRSDLTVAQTSSSALPSPSFNYSSEAGSNNSTSSGFTADSIGKQKQGSKLDPLVSFNASDLISNSVPGSMSLASTVQMDKRPLLAEPQSTTQLESPCQIHKFSLCSSPVPLLCDYSLTPGSLSLANSPHMEKTPQVLDVCHGSHPEETDHEAGYVSVLENSVTAHDNASANLTDLSTQCKFTLNTIDKGKKDLDAEMIHIADDRLKSEDTSENDEACFNSQGVIKDDDRCVIKDDDSVLRTISLNARGLTFASPKSAPITHPCLPSETELQHLEQELCGAQAPRSTSIPVKSHGCLAEPQSTTQFESPCQISKLLLFSSPVPLLCDYSLTPGSMSLANTPHREKTPQVLGVCPDNDPEEPQAEKSERQIRTSFSDPLKSDGILSEYSMSDTLPIPQTAHNAATDNTRDLSPAHNNICNYSGKDIEKGEIHLNRHGIITNYYSDNSLQSSPDETYSTNYKMKYGNIIRRWKLNGSCLNVLSSEAVPFTLDNLFSDGELQHPGQELDIVQTSTSTTARNPQSLTQLESPWQILRLSSSSPIRPQLEKTPQVSGVCPGSDPVGPQTLKSEKRTSTSFGDPHQSYHKFQEHEIGDNSVLENSATAHNNASANLADLSTQSKHALNTTVEGESEDLETEIRKIHIGDEGLRTEEIGEKDEASFTSPGVIKDDPSYNSVQVSSDETCSINHNPKDVNVLRTITLNTSSLNFASPKTAPITHACLPSETELQHPEQELGGAQALRSTSVPVKNHDYLAEPQSATQWESTCQINKLSLFSSPVPFKCDYSGTPGSVSLANTLHMEKTPQVLGVCPGSHPEEPPTEKSEGHRSTSFRDPHQSDDQPPDHFVSDILEISGITFNTATVNLRDINPAHNVTFNNSDEGRIKDPELERKSFQIADAVHRGVEDIRKDEVHLNCRGSITNDDKDNNSQSYPQEQCSSNYSMKYANVIRRITFNGSDLHFLNSEAVPFTQDNLVSENGLHHPEHKLSVVQTPRSTSTLVQNHDFLVDRLSPTRLETPCQVFKPSSSLSSPISPHIQKTPQVSGISPGHDPEELQTGKSERQSNTSFRDPLKSDDKLPKHQGVDDSVLENSSTAPNNTSANFTDVSTQCKLTLNTTDEGKKEDLGAEIRIHIAGGGLKSEEDTSENDETSFNSQGIIKDDDRYNSVQASPEEICPINHNPTDVNVLKTISLNARGLTFASPKTAPIAHASLTSETELQHPKQKLCGAQAPISTSTPLKNNGYLAETQLESPCPTSKLLFSSPVPLLCDYSLTPGSVSLANTPHTEKTPQGLGVCPGSDHEGPQTLKSEKHISTSFRDPHQSYRKLQEDEIGDDCVLENSSTAQNNANILTGFSTQFKLTLNTTDEGESKDLEAEIRRMHIADEVLRTEEIGENYEASCNSPGLIRDHDSYNSVQVSPKETCFINHNPIDVSALRTIYMIASSISFIRPKTVYISDDSLLLETELQHQEQGLCSVQAPRSASAPLKNHLADAQSQTQLESHCQICKTSSSPLLCDYSLTPGSVSANPPHMEKTPQVLGVWPSSHHEEPQTETSERHSSPSFRGPHQSNDKSLENSLSDIFEISKTAQKTAKAALTDLNHGHKLIFNNSDESRIEDPELERKGIHIANEMQRRKRETEESEAHLNSKGIIITNNDSYNSSQSSPEETCSTCSYGNVIKRATLNGSGLYFLSSEAVPFTQDNLLSKTELLHPGQELSVVPKSTSTPVRNCDFFVYPQSPKQLSPCQVFELSSLHSPFSLHMEKTPQASGECPDNGPKELQTGESEREDSTSFRDPHKSDDRLPENEVGDVNVLDNTFTAHNNAMANLTDLSSQCKLTLNTRDKGASGYLKAEIIADERLRRKEETEKVEVNLNCQEVIKDLDSMQGSPDKTCSTNYNLSNVNILGTLSVIARDVNVLDNTFTAHNNAMANLTDLSSQCKLTLNTREKGASGYLKAEIKRIHIADERVRRKEETGKIEVNLNCQEVIKDLDSMQGSPDKTCSTNYNLSNLNILGTLSLITRDLNVLSPKTVPISGANLHPEGQLEHSEQEQSVAQAPMTPSILMTNYLADPQSQTQLESHCQIHNSSSFPSPVLLLCDYSSTPGSVTLANTPHMEKIRRRKGEIENCEVHFNCQGIITNDDSDNSPQSSPSDNHPFSLGSKGSEADLADTYGVVMLDFATEDGNYESVPSSSEETNYKKDSLIQISNTEMFTVNATSQFCSSSKTVYVPDVSSPSDTETQDPRQELSDTNTHTSRHIPSPVRRSKSPGEIQSREMGTFTQTPEFLSLPTAPHMEDALTVSGVCHDDNHEDSQSERSGRRSSTLQTFDASPSPKDIMNNSEIKNKWDSRKPTSLVVSSNELTKELARRKKRNKSLTFLRYRNSVFCQRHIKKNIGSKYKHRHLLQLQSFCKRGRTTSQCKDAEVCSSSEFPNSSSALASKIDISKCLESDNNRSGNSTESVVGVLAMHHDSTEPVLTPRRECLRLLQQLKDL